MDRMIPTAYCRFRVASGPGEAGVGARLPGVSGPTSVEAFRS